MRRSITAEGGREIERKDSSTLCALLAEVAVELSEVMVALRERECVGAVPRLADSAVVPCALNVVACRAQQCSGNWVHGRGHDVEDGSEIGAFQVWCWLVDMSGDGNIWMGPRRRRMRIGQRRERRQE